ncbi:MAG: SWIM zinc finger family protein [Gammaproteobacteria bacterium]|nr:SWIM zinc finger family protein [Gammaproteobacteria bacterium]
MAKSAAQAMLNKTAREVWRRGGAYADSGKVSVAKWDDRGIEATVAGTAPYQVSLRHSGSGFTRRCDCPYDGGTSSGRAICKHLVAVALAWDALRGIPRPTATEVEQVTIPPPEISRRQINALFADPLHADLELLRIYAEAGKWSRPHSQLPKMPPIKVEASRPLSVKEITRVFETMRRWADRTTFDPYFCAGEMMAAFCEVLRVIRARITATPTPVAAEALIIAQRFHRTLVLELIDDSDGLHEFGEAHLDDLFAMIKDRAVPLDQRAIVRKRLAAFEAGRGDY